MQNSNPSPNPSVPFPFCLHEALARAYARAREASAGAPPSASDIFAAYTAPAHEHAGDDARDVAEASAAVGTLDLAELLGVMREPIEWVFTLAERRAQGDPVDLAAIDRLRDAVLHRVDAVTTGAVLEAAPRIRTADLLTVGSLLAGTLDPAIVQRATRGISGGLADALATLIPLVPSIASDGASTPGSFAGRHVPRSVAPSWFYDHVPPAGVPFGAPFAGPPVPRPPVPPWYWPHSFFPY